MVSPDGIPPVGPLSPAREAILSRLISEAEAHHVQEGVVVCLLGPPGSGKSELTRRWVQRLGSGDRRVVLYQSEPPPPGGFLRGLATQLQRDVLEPAPPPDQSELSAAQSLESLWFEIASLSRTRDPTRPLFVAIDGLDEFEATTPVRSLQWLRELREVAAFILLTCAPGPLADAIAQLPWVISVEIPPLEPEEFRLHLRWVWQSRGRQLPEDLLDLLEKRGATVYEAAWRLPLWVELVGEYLLRVGEAKGTNSGEVREPDQPEDLINQAALQREAEAIPLAIEPLCWYILDRCEDVIAPGWVKASLAALALGRWGLRESDLAAVVPKAARLFDPSAPRRQWDSNLWDQLKANLPGWFVYRRNWGTWDFSHKLIRESVTNRYLRDLQIRQRLHLFLAYHLQTLPENDPLRKFELLLHLMGADDRARAANYLSTLPTGPERLYALLPLEHYVLAQAEEVPNPAISWLASLLLEPTLKPDQVAAICLFFHRHLLPWLQGQVDLISVRKLLEAIRQTWGELLRQQPSRADWEAEYRLIDQTLGSLG